MKIVVDTNDCEAKFFCSSEEEMCRVRDEQCRKFVGPWFRDNHIVVNTSKECPEYGPNVVAIYWDSWVFDNIDLDFTWNGLDANTDDADVKPEEESPQ